MRSLRSKRWNRDRARRRLLLLTRMAMSVALLGRVSLAPSMLRALRAYVSYGRWSASLYMATRRERPTLLPHVRHIHTLSKAAAKLNVN